ncbi:type II toxin-antitoxin system HicA family toxin [Actinokineospora sp. G85]|uniref:type II toxin-antitoxin system HicA family toxin n=1 Tax=Actinokineospora sp. G85 TaxID=3406626 RepID=UPI003C753D47
MLEAVGFEYIRTKGSHAVYRNADGRTAIIPMHGTVKRHPRLHHPPGRIDTGRILGAALRTRPPHGTHNEGPRSHQENAGLVVAGRGFEPLKLSRRIYRRLTSEDTDEHRGMVHPDGCCGAVQRQREQ